MPRTPFFTPPSFLTARRPRLRPLLAALLFLALLPAFVGAPALAASCDASEYAASAHGEAFARGDAPDARDETAHPGPVCRLATMQALPAAFPAAPAPAVHRRRTAPESVAFRSATPRRRKHRPKGRSAASSAPARA